MKLCVMFFLFVVGSAVARSTAAESSNCTTVENDTDFNGHDVRSVAADNASHCCLLCDNSADCNFWTLIPDAGKASGTCFFKTSDAGRRGMGGYTSGASGPWRCARDEDCSLNGVCDVGSGACACDRPWGSLDCSKLQFKAASTSTCGQACAYHAMDAHNTSWGGSIIPAEGRYYMAAAEMAGGCSLGQWLTNSQVVLAVADDVTGPYSKVGVAIAPWAHNPQIVRAHDGTFLIFALGNGSTTPNPHGEPVQCARRAGVAHVPPPRHRLEGSTGTRPRRAPSQGQNKNKNKNQTVGFVLHYSDSPKGPWAALPVTLDDFQAGDNMDNWNPAPVALPDGRVRIMVHTDPAPWAGEVVYEAPHWRGPYKRLTGDVMAYCSHCQEDPFMWVDRRGRWHALLHKMFDDGGYAPSSDPVPSPGWPGGHIYSRDGLLWSRQQRAYSTNITMLDGTVLVTRRRERPKLVFDSDGVPTHLTNGVILASGETYTTIVALDA
eukprot:g4325.t1